MVLFLYPILTSGEVLPRRTPQLLINSLFAALLLCGLAKGQSVPDETVPPNAPAVQEAAPAGTVSAEEAAEPSPSSALPKSNAVQMVIRRIEVQHEDEGSAVQITSSGALIPNITKLDGPPRLVIDLAESVAAAPQGRIPVQAEDIKSIRLTQYQNNPPITRIVVDLNKPSSYSWEAIENKLVVHVRPPDASANTTDSENSEVAFTKGTEPLVSSGSGGTGVMVPASYVGGGSAVTAGAETAILNLARGGQVRVCPGTTVSLSSDAGGKDLLLAMSTGALEAHYNQSVSSDSILTPDFRILLAGPGQHHYAVSADSKGNTCVRTLPGNTAPAVVSELIGDGTYQVKPNEQVVFRSGQLSKVDNDVPVDCGCPTQQHPILRAEAAVPVPGSPTPGGEPLPTASQGQATDATIAPETVTIAEWRPNRKLPPDVTLRVAPHPAGANPSSNDLRVQVDAPLVFRADQTPPAPTEEVGRLPAVSGLRGEPMKVVVQPPTAAQKRDPKPGVFGHIKNFFKTLFG